jgi:hypothetical protein
VFTETSVSTRHSTRPILESQSCWYIELQQRKAEDKKICTHIFWNSALNRGEWSTFDRRSRNFLLSLSLTYEDVDCISLYSFQTMSSPKHFRNIFSFCSSVRIADVLKSTCMYGFLTSLKSSYTQTWFFTSHPFSFRSLLLRSRILSLI